MSIAMLPKLNPNKDVKPWMGKRWKRVSSLKEIADALEQIDTDRSRNLFSIPDVYEKAVRFTNIIRTQEFGENATLAEEVIQWRSLLTILALQGIRDFPVTFEKIELDDYQNGFAKSLQLQPKDCLLKDRSGNIKWSWTPFYVMKFNKIDVAVFSPATLLYPVVDLEEKLKECGGLPWYDETGHFFYEPQMFLTEEEKILVYAWLVLLEGLLKKIGSLKNRNDVEINERLLASVMRNVRSYQKDLGVDVENIPDSLFTQWRWIQQKHFCFETRSYGINAASILNVTMNPIIEIGKRTISLNQIFSEKLLYMVSEKNPFSQCRHPECYELQGYSSWNTINHGYMGEQEAAYALLPFSENFMNDLAECGENILKSLAASIKMTCLSELTGGEEQQYVLVEADLSKIYEKNFKVSKKYYVEGTTKNVCVLLENRDIFMLCLWPGVATRDWSGYYTYFKHEKSREDNPSYEMILPIYPGKTKKGIHSIKTDYFPKSFGFRRDNEFYGLILPEKPEEIVPDLTQRAVVAVDFGTTGTKVFAKVDGVEEEIHLEDENILTFVDAVHSLDSKQILLGDEFIPERDSDKSQKLFSVYHYFSRDKSILDMIIDGNIYMPGESIYLWENNDFNMGGGKVQLANNKLVTNIKWDSEATAKYFSAFLMQLCMQTSVYLLKRYHISGIEWRYSVPSSMEITQIARIRKTWQGICEEMRKMTGLEHRIMGNNLDIYEGYAASYYFSHNGGGNYPQGFFAIDIGGGTTDIALWQKSTGKDRSKLSACMQMSVTAAGRKILTAAIWDYLEDFQRLARDDEQLDQGFSMLLKRKNSSRRDPGDDENAAIDKLIAVNNEMIKKLIHTNTGAEGSWVNKFQARLAMNISMLMFCLGKMMAECIFNGNYVIGESTAPFKICMGGNGSCILDWVGVTDWDELSEELKEPYINVFRSSRAFELKRLKDLETEKNGMREDYIGADRLDWRRIERTWNLQNIDVKIYKSPRPKQEIAEGLLKINDALVREMDITKVQDARTIDRETLGDYTEGFLHAFQEEFSQMGYYGELVNGESVYEKGKIHYKDPGTVRSRIDQLFRQDNNLEQDAAMSRDIYDCMFNYVLLNFLIEDIRP